jgi:hypothetical protein
VAGVFDPRQLQHLFQDSLGNVPASASGPGQAFAYASQRLTEIGRQFDPTNPLARYQPVSILGSILRAPASQPGQSSSLGGDLLQFGAGLFGNWANARSAARSNRQANRQMMRQQQGGFGGYSPGWQPAPGMLQPYGNDNITIPSGGNSPMSILDSSMGAYQQAVYQPSSAAPYVDANYQTAGALEVVPQVVRGIAASRTARTLVAWLVRNGMSALAAGGAAAGIVELFGGAGAADGPYANPKHNRVTGIMRGDVMAMRRVKRSGKRLQKALRMAGVGVRRSSGRFRRRRAC